MKRERIVICILLVIVGLFVIDKFNIQAVKPAKAQVSIDRDGTTIPKILTKELRSEEIYANHVYVLGYDLVKLHEETLNLLISKNFISKIEGVKILEKARTAIAPKKETKKTGTPDEVKK